MPEVTSSLPSRLVFCGQRRLWLCLLVQFFILEFKHMKITTGRPKRCKDWKKHRTYFLGVENSDSEILDIFGRFWSEIWSFGLNLLGLLLSKVCKVLSYCLLFFLLVLLGMNCQWKLRKWYFCLVLKCVKFNENFPKTLTWICGWGVTPDFSLT